MNDENNTNDHKITTTINNNAGLGRDGGDDGRPCESPGAGSRRPQDRPIPRGPVDGLRHHRAPGWLPCQSKKGVCMCTLVPHGILRYCPVRHAVVVQLKNSAPEHACLPIDRSPAVRVCIFLCVFAHPPARPLACWIQHLVEQVLQLGIRASPDHGPLYRSWAQMEYQLGNTAESRRKFEQGLEACPTYTRLYYAYADMEASMVRRFIPMLAPSSFRLFVMPNSQLSVEDMLSLVVTAAKARQAGVGVDAKNCDTLLIVSASIGPWDATDSS